MAYTSNRLSLVTQSIERQGSSQWVYITADSLATVKGASYFSDATKKGLKVGDFILVGVGTLDVTVYPSSGASTKDVGAAADFSSLTQAEWVMVSSISSGAATVVGTAADLGSNVIIGDSSSSTVGFYGATVTTQPTSASEAAVSVNTITTAATTTTPWGYGTSTQANNIATEVASVVTLANQLRADLVTLGLIKGS